MPPLARIDDIGWLEAALPSGRALLFATDPYLPSVSPGTMVGKLIYLERPAFEQGNIKKRFGSQDWYSVVNKVCDGRAVPVEDDAIQTTAAGVGLQRALGYHANLSTVAPSVLRRVTWSLPLASITGCDALKSVASKMADFYGVSRDEFRVTGGTALAGAWSDASHDLDVVVPIHSEAQAASISRTLRPEARPAAVEYGLRWPFRWRSDSGVIVCPFFVYGNMAPRWISAEPTGEVFCGEMLVTDDTYGLMNTPLFETLGPIPHLVFRTRLVRGVLRNGQSLRVNAPVFQLTSNGGAVERAVVVTNPFAEIPDFEHLVLGPWYA